MVNRHFGIMGWESFGVVGFDLGPCLQGQTRIAKLESAYNLLIMVLEVWDGKQPIGNHWLKLYWCGQIQPWTPPSRSNKDSET